MIIRTQSSLKNKRTRLRAQALNAIDNIKIELGSVAAQIALELTDYPPERENQKYVRTYELAAGWARGITPVQEAPDGTLFVEFSNDATDPWGRQYAELVQSKEEQLEIHQGRWDTIEEIQARHAHEQANRVRAAIRRSFR